jgi:hypothetical protein
MRCDLCGRFHVHDISFNELFEKPALCPTCEKKIAVEKHMQVIPVSGGTIEYHTLHENNAFIRSNELYLDHQYAHLFRMALNRKNEDAVILFLNLREYETMGRWLPYANMDSVMMLFGQYPLDLVSKLDNR